MIAAVGESSESTNPSTQAQLVLNPLRWDSRYHLFKSAPELHEMGSD